MRVAKYANQRIIRLGHLEDIIYKKGDSGAWLQPLRWDAIKLAMNTLNGNAFKLWIYLLSWEGKGTYEFSPANLAKELKMSDEGARNARRELITKGYLVEIDNHVSEFFPFPQ